MGTNKEAKKPTAKHSRPSAKVKESGRVMPVAGRGKAGVNPPGKVRVNGTGKVRVASSEKVRGNAARKAGPNGAGGKTRANGAGRVRLIGPGSEELLMDNKEFLRILTEVRNGNFSVRMPIDEVGVRG